MDLFLLYLFLFIVGCMLGYLLEVLFRRFFSAKKWVNPGFMKGPWLPLYGFGIVVLFTLVYAFVSALPSLPFYDPTNGRGPSVYDLIPILLMGTAMNLLEFVAGLIFVKGFKVRLWDYRNMKGNIMGIVCPLFAVIWFALSILYYYLAHPFVYRFAMDAYAYMFGQDGKGAHFAFIFLLGVVYGVFLIDLVVSVGLFSKVAKLAKSSPLASRYEELRQNVNKMKKEAGERFFSALPQKVQDDLRRPKEPNQTVEKAKEKLASALLIDPNIADKPGDNYDESGRPKKGE